MRSEDYIVEPAKFENLQVGDLLKSANGRTFRRIILKNEHEVIVRIPGGSVTNLPAESIEPFWQVVHVLSSDTTTDV